MSLLKAKLRNTLTRARISSGKLAPEALQNLHALDDLKPGVPASAYNYVVLDLETTGLDRKADTLLSVGAVRVVKGRIRLGDIFCEMINPDRSIPADSIKIHGITPDQVNDARSAIEVLQDLLPYVGQDILVAHHAGFDMNFLNRIMEKRFGFPMQNLVLDTASLCKQVVLPSDPYGINRHEGSCSLDSLMARFGLEAPERHTAFGDALATALIFQRMLAMLEHSGRNTLGELARMAALS